MEAFLVPIALFLSIAFATVGVTRIITDARTRRRLLEANASPQMAAALVTRPGLGSTQATALKWGLVLGTIGVALIIIQFLPYDEDDPITAGIVLVSAAIGLVGGYAIEQRIARRDPQRSTRA